MHYHQQDRESFIQHLAERFPKCFFVNPEMRLPLKHGIEVDLAKQKVLDIDKVAQALEWYKSEFRYMRKILMGAERVGLDGETAGKVTYPEQEKERTRMLARKRELHERRELRQKSIELARRQVATVAAHQPPPAVPDPAAEVQEPTPRKEKTAERDHALIELARNMQPARVSDIVTAALNSGMKLAATTIQNRIYGLVHDGEIPADWIKRHLIPSENPAPRPPISNSRMGTVTETLRARVALFEVVLANAHNTPNARQMAADVADMVTAEIAALVSAL